MLVIVLCMKVKLQNLILQKLEECQHFSNMRTPTSLNMLEPLIGPTVESLLAEMEETFPPTNPHPKEELAPIMFRAGQRSVIEWYTNRLKESK